MKTTTWWKTCGIAAFVTMLWALPARAALPLPLPPGAQSDTITVGGITRSYLIYAPQSYDGMRKVPLLFAFHGNLGSAEDMEVLTLGKLNQLADTYDVLVVYPDGIDHSWNDGRGVTPASDQNIDDVGFI